jgi:phage gp29-like protein
MAKKKQDKKSKKLKAKGSLVSAKKDNKNTRTSFKFDSKAKAILKSLFDLPIGSDWLDEDTIDKILRDSTVSAAIGRRKAATLKKEIYIACDDENIKTDLEECFDYDTLDSMLDIPLQGFGVFELIWKQKGDLYYPTFHERPYQNFTLEDKILKYSQNGIPQDIPMHKAVYGVYKAKPNKPYGQPLYNPLYWLIEFKNASMEFWIELLERFGTPWVIAKTQGNKNDMADEIYNMLGGDGAVIDDEDEIELKTADKVGNFKEIIAYIDDQIRELITGGNLTGNVQGGSQAAATVHDGIREDLARADENIINNIIKQAVKLFKEGNYLTIDIEVKLKDKDDPNKVLADRDKVIHDMGYRPKKDYIEKTYNIEVEDAPTQDTAAMPFSNTKMKFSKELPQDELEHQTNSIDTSKSFTFQEQILEIIQNSTSYEDAQEKLLEAYKDIDIKDLQELLGNNMANADILARAEIEDENPDG